MIKTKQELLNHFSDINEMYNNPFMYQTLSNMIDELLEQQSSYNSVKSELEPCEDCISREAVLDELDKYIDKAQSTGTRDDFISFQELVVKSLPSVTPSNDAIRKAYIKGYDYGVKDWFKSKTQPCEDCISREDALKAIEEQKKGFYGVERYAIDECHSAVMKLPSVRPCREIVEDKRACEKCIHYVTRDSRGVVLCGCDSWECDFEEVKK